MNYVLTRFISFSGLKIEKKLLNICTILTAISKLGSPLHK